MSISFASDQDGSDGSAGAVRQWCRTAEEWPVIDDPCRDDVRIEERLGPGAERFGLRLLARLAGDARRGVELAADSMRGDLLAIKHVSTQDLVDPEASSRLEREHRVLRRLDHPGVRRAVGWRRDRSGTGGRSVALLMRFVDGATLDRWESPDLPALCRAMAGVCRALAHVHERGFVHGDLRPRHVLIDGDDRAVVISFGRAQQVGGVFPAESVKHAYAAPERLDGRIATPRADVFGVGATLAALLLRQPPIQNLPRESLGDRLQRHEVLSATLADAGTHPALVRIIDMSMHPDPLRRPAFVESIGSRLESVADTLERRRRLAA
jgi:serine/threonine protein kinase